MQNGKRIDESTRICEHLAIANNTSKRRARICIALLFQPLMDCELREVFEFARVTVGICERVSKYVFNKLI